MRHKEGCTSILYFPAHRGEDLRVHGEELGYGVCAGAAGKHLRALFSDFQHFDNLPLIVEILDA